MLGNAHFYHQLTRKSVILFGRMFDDITLIRKNDQTGAETQRFVVPIIYAPKEKMITRLFADPDLQKQLGVLLPRMSFEITGISYDATRKQNSLLRASRANTTTHVTSSYMGVPYDISFNLNIYTRNIDDANHIMEQIIPFFNPDFTVTTNMIPDLGMLKDIPIVLNSVTDDIQYEGDFDTVRYVYKTLNFTMKTYYWGPISYPKIIRTVYANIYNDPNLRSGYITRINASDITGTFKVDDLVYKGGDYKTANAFGMIVNVNKDTGKVVLGGVQGQLKEGDILHAVSTDGVFTISTFDASPMLLAGIKITPFPVYAEPTDDYGYNIDIIEWPRANTDYPPLVSTDSTKYTSDDEKLTTDNE